jgi:hypothetical protein
MSLLGRRSLALLAAPLLVALSVFVLAGCGEDEPEAAPAATAEPAAAPEARAADEEAIGVPPASAPPPPEGPPTVPEGGEPSAEAAPELARAPRAAPIPVATLDVPLAYTSNEDGDDEIYLLGPGGVVTKLTDNPASDGYPALSPDGTRISFHSNQDGEDYEIYVMNADGTGLAQLTDDATGDGFPAWSPDGTRIAWNSKRGGTWEIWTMNPDGSDPVQVSTAGGNHPAFSPDPSAPKLAWTADPNGDEKWSLFVASADGSGAAEVTPPDQHVSKISWSPDGSRIAYDSPADGDWDVYSMNADGSDVVQLTTDPSVDGGPAFLADGRLLFISNRNGDFDVFVMNADGSGLAQVTTGSANEIHPAVALGASEGGSDVTEAEAQLLSHIPEDVRPTCQRDAAWFEEELAHLYCTSGQIGATYILMADAAAASAEYEKIAGGMARDQGDCRSDPQGEGSWLYSDQQPGGRMLCFDTTQGGRWVVWTTDALAIFSAAYHPGGDRQALFDFWLIAGPW